MKEESISVAQAWPPGYAPKISVSGPLIVQKDGKTCRKPPRGTQKRGEPFRWKSEEFARLWAWTQFNEEVSDEKW